MANTSTTFAGAELPTRKEIETAALGGLVGGIVSGIVLQFGSVTLQRLAGVVGFDQTIGNGWGTFLIFAIILGIAFAGVVTQLVDRYVAFVVSLTSRSDLVRGAVMPLTNRFGMRVVVTAAMGLIYGLLLGVVLVGIVIPLRVAAVPLPNLAAVGMLGFVVYGLVLGITYGVKVVG